MAWRGEMWSALGPNDLDAAFARLAAKNNSLFQEIAAHPERFRRCTEVTGVWIEIYPIVPRGGSVAHTKRWKRWRREQRRKRAHTGITQ